MTPVELASPDHARLTPESPGSFAWPGTDDGPVTVRHLQGRAGLVAAEADWRAVLSRMSTSRLEHQFEWCASFADALPSDDALHLFVVHRGARAEAIVPLTPSSMSVGPLRIRALALPHSAHVPLCDILCGDGVDPADVLDRVMRSATKVPGLRWDMLHLPRILAASPTARALAARTVGRRPIARRSAAPCLWLSTSRTHAELTATLSRKFRANLRNARNKLTAVGEITSDVVRDRDALPAVVDEFFQLEASGWKGSSGTGTAIVLHPPLVRFYRALMERFGESRRCEVNVLRVAGAAVAAQFCLVAGGVHYWLKMAYDEAHASKSPGHLHLDVLLQRLCADPSVQMLNFVSDAAWLSSWEPASAEVEECFVGRWTARGLSAVLLLHVGRGVRHHLMPALRRWVQRSARSLRQIRPPGRNKRSAPA